MSPIEFDELKDDGLDELLDKALENMHVNKNSEVSLEKSNVSLSETVAARFGLLESVKTAKFEDNYLFPDKIDNVLKSLLEVVCIIVI